VIKIAIFIFILYSNFITNAQSKNEADLAIIKSQYGDETLSYYKYKGNKGYEIINNDYETDTTSNNLDDCGCEKKTKTKIVGPIISKTSQLNIYTDREYQKSPKWQTKVSCPKCSCTQKKKKKKTIITKTPTKKSVKQVKKAIINQSTGKNSTRTIKKVQKDVIIKKYYIYRDTVTTCCGNNCCGDCCDAKEEAPPQVILRCE